jgi:PBSX family phage terminase large subunit
MNVLKEYTLLYKKDYYTADCFGGRAGARSYSITQFALYQILYSDYFRCFFLRDVHSTIYSSIWKDFKDRIEEFEENHHSLSGIIQYTDNKNGENQAINLINGNSITTKGFKVSSGNQTASLKSLAGGNCIIIEEFQEVEKDDYLKLKLSLRKKGVNIQIVRAFNPVPKDHFIWEDYELNEIDETDLISRICSVGGVDFETATKLRMKNNDKKYFVSKPLESNHISIQCNYTNNIINLNPVAIEAYKKLLFEDFHYFCVEIIGLIPDRLGNSVYSDYDDIKHHTDRDAKDTDALFIGMDFNITKMSAIVHIFEDGEAKAVDEFVGYYDTHEICTAIKKRYQNARVTIYPDASGNNRRSAGASDIEVIKRFKFNVITANKNPLVKDRVNTVNEAFRTGKYKVNRFKCPNYSHALKNIVYKNGEPDKSNGLDHSTDAGGYYIYYIFGSKKTRLLI